MHIVHIPKIVTEAFTRLTRAHYIRRISSPIPLVPDTTFDIFALESGQLLTLVTTDYADPRRQSEELKKASGHYEFEFDSLVLPYTNEDRSITILEHDEMTNNFFVKELSTYYYVANTRYAPLS